MPATRKKKHFMYSAVTVQVGFKMKSRHFRLEVADCALRFFGFVLFYWARAWCGDLEQKPPPFFLFLPCIALRV